MKLLKHRRLHTQSLKASYQTLRANHALIPSIGALYYGRDILVAMIFIWLPWKPNKPICDARKKNKLNCNHGRLVTMAKWMWRNHSLRHTKCILLCGRYCNRRAYGIEFRGCYQFSAIISFSSLSNAVPRQSILLRNNFVEVWSFCSRHVEWRGS